MGRATRTLAAGMTAVALAAVAGSTAAQPLPEGDTGIAAGYPADVGIESAPGVVFSDDFEDAPGAELEVGHWDNVYGTISIIQDAAKVHAGSRSVEITHVSPQSNGAWRDFGDAGFDTLHVRYYLKYDPQYPGAHHTGMAIHAGAPGWDIGAGTGVVPNGTTHFTALLDNLAPYFDWSPPGNEAPGHSYVYCYHMNQGSQWGDVFFPSGEVLPGSPDLFGPDFVPKPDIILELGQWYSFELMVEANTPGATDGRVAFWIDGVLSADFPNLEFRSVDSLKPNYVILATYTADVFPNQTIWYDDIVAATSYIGPMVREGTAAASSASSATSGGTGDSTSGPDAGGASSGPGAGGSTGSTDPDSLGADDGASEGGCGCRQAPAPGTSPLIACLAGVLLLVRRSRRRRIAAAARTRAAGRLVDLGVYMGVCRRCRSIYLTRSTSGSSRAASG